MMPQFQPDFTFSEAVFERILAEIDTDGNGDVDQEEMTDFIIKMLQGTEEDEESCEDESEATKDFQVMPSQAGENVHFERSRQG